MPRFVALLRSVNVAGRSLGMARLRDVLRDAGFSDVTTYIQSGNVVFTSASRSGRATATIAEAAIKDAFSVDVPVLVRTRSELQRVVDRQPFAKRHDPKSLHVTFLSGPAAAARVRSIDAARSLPDEFKVAGSEIYVACPNGYGRTKLNNTFFERALQTVATTRNWNTVQKLLALSE
jgi:uncharacterized protein (DUF1697 family)